MPAAELVRRRRCQVAMQLMQVRHMCMAVAGWLMPMQMAAWYSALRVMHVVAVLIVKGIHGVD